MVCLSNVGGNKPAGMMKLMFAMIGKTSHSLWATGASEMFQADLTEKIVSRTHRSSLHQCPLNVRTYYHKPMKLHTYTAQPICVVGQMMVQVKYQGYVGEHKLPVVEGKGPPLLGRVVKPHPARLDIKLPLQ